MDKVSVIVVDNLGISITGIWLAYRKYDSNIKDILGNNSSNTVMTIYILGY